MLNFANYKLGGVAVSVLALGVMGCAHPHHVTHSSEGQPAVVEEVVIVEEPVYEKQIVQVDCGNPHHRHQKECVGY